MLTNQDVPPTVGIQGSTEDIQLEGLALEREPENNADLQAKDEVFDNKDPDDDNFDKKESPPEAGDNARDASDDLHASL